ncbi:MAG: hypothetical protein IJF66_00595 [Clostridia bacterium]|nr:hypothetical protein [Clostridia bacterium]
MTKKTSIVLVSIIMALLLCLAVFSFLPDGFDYGEYNRFYSPLNLIQKSNLFTDSVEVKYSVELGEDVDAKDVISTVRARLNKAFGYYGSTITLENDVLTVVLPKTAASEDNSNLLSIANQAVCAGKIEVLASGTYDANSVLLSSEDFARAVTKSYVQQGTHFPICEVTLTKEAAEDAKYHLSSGQTYYYFVDGVSTYAAFYQNGKIQLYSQPGAQAHNKLIARYVNAGVIDATFEKESHQALPHNHAGLIFAIVFGVLVVAGWVYLVARYKALGLAGILSQLIVAIVFIVFSGCVHIELFNLAAYIGAIIVYAAITALTAVTFDRIKNYAKEKTFASAKYRAFLDGNKFNLIAHGAALLLGVILWLIPTVVTAPLGNVLVYGAVLSFVATMLLNRIFVALVTPLVEDNAYSGARK